MFEEPETEPAWEIEARREMAMGNKDNAIKIVRDNTGVGRQEARELVEAWERAGNQPPGQLGLDLEPGRHQ